MGRSQNQLAGPLKAKKIVKIHLQKWLPYILVPCSGLGAIGYLAGNND